MSHNPPRRAASRRASIQLLTAPHRRSLQLPHGDVDSFCAASSLFASADRAPSCLPPGHLPLVSEVSLDPYRAATEAEEVQRSLTKDHASSSCTAPCIPKSSSKSNLSGLCRSNSCGNNSGNLGSIHAAAKSPRTYLSALLVVVLLCCTAFEAGLWSCSHSSGIPTLTTTPKVRRLWSRRWWGWIFLRQAITFAASSGIVLLLLGSSELKGRTPGLQKCSAHQQVSIRRQHPWQGWRRLLLQHFTQQTLFAPLASTPCSPFVASRAPPGSTPHPP